MEFVSSFSVFIKTSLILLYLMIIFSLPLVFRRVWLGFHKKDFKCIMCGNCCRFSIITLTDEDIKRIEDAGQKDFIENVSLSEKKLRRVNGRCLFNKDDKCGIYESRPNVCRNFPFQSYFGIPYLRDWSCCPGIDEFKRKMGKK